MSLLASAQNLYVRFRYPVSLPQDIGFALGIPISNYISFSEFIEFLLSNECKPTKLTRFMSREKVEMAFEKAQKKELFHQHSLFSFYFNQGWLEFDLEFDAQSRLRRIHMHHKLILHPQGFELVLPHIS